MKGNRTCPVFQPPPVPEVRRLLPANGDRAGGAVRVGGRWEQRSAGGGAGAGFLGNPGRRGQGQASCCRNRGPLGNGLGSGQGPAVFTPTGTGGFLPSRRHVGSEAGSPVGAAPRLHLTPAHLPTHDLPRSLPPESQCSPPHRPPSALRGILGVQAHTHTRYACTYAQHCAGMHAHHTHPRRVRLHAMGTCRHTWMCVPCTRRACMYVCTHGAGHTKVQLPELSGLGLGVT